MVGNFPAEAQRRSNDRDSQNRETGMEMHGSFFYRDEGDKMGGHHRDLVSDADLSQIPGMSDPVGMGFATQSRLPLGSSLQADLQECCQG